MRKPTRVTAAIAGGALVVASAGVAYAYWTTTGTGAGTAGTASSSVSAIVIAGASTGLLSPGVTVPLSGTATNPNAGSVAAGPVTAAITGIEDAAGTDITDACAPSNYTLGGSTGSIGVLTASSESTTTDSKSWSGLTLEMEDGMDNQDACKDAVVHLSFSATATDQ